MSAQMPKHAPYQDVKVGEPIEVRAFVDDDGWIVAECEYRGDTFGSKLDPNGLDNLSLTLEVDKLVSGVCALAWSELYGTPVFRDEDEEFVGRVDAQKPWEKLARVATQGWIGSTEGGEPAVTVAPEEPAREGDSIAATLGDADVSELRLSQEEMAELTRGEIPETLIGRLLKARSTENLLDSAAAAILDAKETNGDPGLERAALELGEVRRRFRHES